MSPAAIEVAGNAIGADGTGSASNGAINKLPAISQGNAQPGAPAETFGSRWQAFLHSLGMEPPGLAVHEGTDEEELDPQPTENLTGELGQIQARLNAPVAADLPSQQQAGLRDGSVDGSPRIRTAGFDQADATLGNQTAARAQKTAYGDRAEIGNAPPAGEHAVDKRKGFERNGEAHDWERGVAHDVSAPGVDASELIAGFAAIPGTPTLPPSQSSPTAARFAESFLSNPSLESDGASAGSRAGVRLGTQQGGAQLHNTAAATRKTPVAPGSIISGVGAAWGETLAAPEGAAADEEMRAIGSQESALAHAHFTVADGPSEGVQNRNQSSFPSESYLTASVDGSLSGGQSDQATQATDAGVLAATQIAGEGKLQPALESPSTEQMVHRTARISGLAEAVQPGAHSLSPQSAAIGEAGGTGAVGVILPHDPGDVRSALDALHNGSAALTENTRTGVQETFTALDAGVGPGTMSWVHAGPQRAEAGFQDPALGWIGVRADLGGGAAVHAAVLAGSSEAAQALGGHLAGLNTYLTEHHAGVASLTMTSPDDASVNWGDSPGAMQQGPSGNNPQNGASEPQTNGSFSPAAAIQEIPAQSGGLPVPESDVRQGRHISVMA